MSMIDSFLPMSNNNNNNNSRYFDYGGSPTHNNNNNNFLLSPSSSSSIIKNNYSILRNIIPGEEISTIFVVGFPDNMQEREFQNMFLFSPGFEAATLKVPTINSMLTISSLNTVEDENNRKQIIGFAKFRTRLEALDAKEILNGKKIDQERGCILKAEMAKKNLHTKKEQLMPVKSPYEAFHSVPILQDTPQQQQQQQRIIPTTTKSTTCTYTPKNSLFGMLANNNNNNNKPTTTTTTTTTVDYPFLLHKLYNNHHTSLPLPPPASHQQILQQQKQQDIMTQLLVSSSASTPILPKESDFYNNRLLLLNTMDQNPPCNTLYVGNLPMNTNEEELRMIFSNCKGYKRLSFRTKSNNGPMCFVEFEDIHFATIALKELNGNPLSNSIKGGIRLSFSKNSLGVRQNIVH